MTIVPMTLAIGLWLSAMGARAAEDRVALNDVCALCHTTQAEQWSGSEHATAFTDAPFTAALAREPQAFCRGCHAPEQDPRLTEVTPASAIGVACVSCHVDDTAPVTVRDGHLALVDAVDCASCHEFGFPDDALREHPLAMQRTATEHRDSPAADQSCASCHMERATTGAHDHRFAVTRDAAVIGRSLDIAATRPTATRIRVVLDAAAVGHAVPTGDLFRRLEVGAEVIDGSGRPARRWLGRRFETRIDARGIALVQEVADDRVPAGGSREVVVELADAAGHDVRWWVRHQRVAFPRGRDPAAAVLDGETTIAEGVLAAAP